jgi:hypothetical protein
MASIDLKPVSDETIEEMGYSTQDLWFVKHEATIYGPFETLSLKHYAAENSALFIDAFACISDSQTWTPFFEIEGFEPPQKVNYDHSEGPFWVLVDGQKSAPLSKHDLQKKIEMNIIAKTDLYSADEGHTWHKIYEIPEFDHRHEPDQLPAAPGEKSFQKAKLELVDKIEHSHGQSQQDGLASLAHLGQKKNEKTVVLKLDEITINAVQETDVSRSLKWEIPAMFGCVLTMGLTGWYIFSPKSDAPLAEVSEEIVESDQKPEIIMPRIQYQPRVVEEQNVQQEMPIRRPASVAPMRGHERSALTRTRSMPQSEFPTHMETHGDPQDRDVDPRDVDQSPQRAPREEPANLVQQGFPNNDDGSLDMEMNREPANHDPAIDPPVLEEATDF